MTVPNAINAAIVKGRPTGKNHPLPGVIRSIKKELPELQASAR